MKVYPVYWTTRGYQVYGIPHEGPEPYALWDLQKMRELLATVERPMRMTRYGHSGDAVDLDCGDHIICLTACAIIGLWLGLERRPSVEGEPDESLC